MTESLCKHCRFYESVGNSIGACHAHPPAFQYGGMYPGSDFFPRTSPYNWCGDFQPQPADEPIGPPTPCQP